MTHYILPDDVKCEYAKHLQDAFSRSEIHNVDVWLQRCKYDTAQLWNLNDFWAVTEVLKTKTGMALHIVAAAGKYNIALVESMENWGKSIGCKNVYFTGRRGWAKRMLGYKLTTITMKKRL